MFSFLLIVFWFFEIPFNHYKPYPKNKRPMLDFRIKPGQLKNITAWEQDAISEVGDLKPKWNDLLFIC